MDALQPSGGGDAAAVIGRLEALEVARKAEREQRLAEARDQADPRESVEGFLAWFGQQQADVQGRCSRLTGGAQASEAGAPCGDAAARLGEVEALLAQVAGMEQALADASYFLPSYDLRAASASAQALRAELEAAKAALAPRRKFAFGAKRVSRAPAAAAHAPEQQQTDGRDPGSASAGPAAVALPAADSSEQARGGGGGGGATPPGPHQPAAGPQPISPEEAELVAAGRGVRGLRGGVMVVQAADLAGGEFVVHDCRGVAIALLGPLRALRLRGLQDCTVAAGPVAGATFADGLQRCTLHLASQQVRIHSSADSDFYLQVRSRPIIEHSRGLRFAPLAADDAAQLQPPAAAGSGQPDPAAAGLWREVEDFGWVKATQSPHWSELPLQERRPMQLPGAEAG